MGKCIGMLKGSISAVNGFIPNLTFAQLLLAAACAKLPSLKRIAIPDRLAAH